MNSEGRLYVPYVPFEWVVGAWVLISGLAVPAELRLADRRPSPVI